MKFRFVGQHSHGTDRHEQMRVLFIGREPSEVTEDAAIRWFTGHPDYQAVEEVIPEDEAPKPAKKARKAK